MIVAVSLVALLGMGMIVVDVANWWVHKRHLQTQADAAALAGGTLLREGCLSSDVKQQVANYATAGSWTTPGMPSATVLENSQIGVGQSESVLGAFNADGYPGTSAGTTTPSDPCTNALVDVKLTDKNIPYLLPAFGPGVLGRIDAHARYQSKQVSAAAGLLPFAAEDPVPLSVRAVVVDETSGAVLGSVFLTKSAGCQAGFFCNSTSFALPAQSGSAVSGDPVGIRINASGTINSDGTPDVTAASTPAACDTHQQCFDTQSSNGLVQLRAWPDASQHPANTDVAMIHRVQVSAPQGNCLVRGSATGYFADLPAVSPACSSTATVSADVEFGGTGVNYPPVNGTGATTAAVNLSTDGGTTSTAMVYQGAHVWQGTVNIPNEADAPTALSLQAVAHSGKISVKNGQPKDCSLANLPGACSGSFSQVQRIFSAAGSTASRTGLLDSLLVTDNSSPTAPDDTYSLSCGTTCPTHNYTIAVHFHDGLKPDTTTGATPTPVLRSQGNTVSCSGQSNLAADIQGACGWYRAYRFTAVPPLPADSGCPDAATAYPNNSLATNPSECADVRNGNGANPNAVGSALSQRINKPTPTADVTVCNAPNNWSSQPDFPTGDPRLVTLFTIFRWPSSNNGSLPVTGLAEFYVTGWKGNGTSNTDPCGTDAVGLSNGDVVGHFVNADILPAHGVVGNQACDFNSPTPCLAALVE